MECANCHQDLAEGDAFCRHCGTKAPALPGPCPSCGRVNEEDARFCVECGTSLTSEVAPAADAAQSPDADAAQAPDATADAAPEPAEEAAAALPVAAPVADSSPESGATTAEMPDTAAAEAPPPAAPAAQAVPAAAPATPATTMKTLTLVGAAAAAVGTFLPWLSATGNSANGFDVPVNFLIDYQTTAGHDFSAGLIVLALAAAAAVAVLQPKMAARIPLLPVALLILVVAGAYLGQLWRLTDDLGVSYTEFVGLGTIVVAVGGALILTRR